MSQKILLLINGGRKPVADNIRHQIEFLMHRHNPENKVIVSKTLEEATRWLMQAKRERFDGVWIGGGDGSLLHAVNVLIDSGISLGVVPFGTVNALARSLNIPLNPVSAVEKLLEKGYCFPFDVGRVNQKHYFLCFGSIGYDAMTVHQVRSKMKKIFGRIAYGFYGIRNLFAQNKIQRFSFNETNDREAMEGHGYSMVFSNVVNYAGINLFENATPFNGCLDAIIFHRNQPMDFINWLISPVIKTGKLQGKNITFSKISIKHEGKVFFQLDGDAIEIHQSEDITIECLPGKIQFWGIR